MKTKIYLPGYGSIGTSKALYYHSKTRGRIFLSHMVITKINIKREK